MTKPKGRLIPVVVLISLSVVTVVATRSVVRAGMAKRAAQAAAGRVIITSNPTMAIEKAVGGRGSLEVGASASLGHKEKDQELVWYLTAYRRGRNAETGDGQWEVAWSQQYDQQDFVVPKGRIASPTFREKLVMPPGTYTVEIGVKEILRSVVNPDDVRAIKIASKTSTIVVD